MKKHYRRCFSILLPIIAAGCVTPYEPSVITENGKYLVVDAAVSSEDNMVKVNLSRTIPLYPTEPPARELNATVSLDDREGTSHALTEKGDGLYEQAGLSLDPEKEYRLHIRTSTHQEYFSEYVPIRNSPPIDSVFWLAESDGIRIYVNTHDDSGNTRYYKWTYYETWEYRSVFTSALKLVNKIVYYRQPDEYIHRCWSENLSNNILVTSSTKFKADAISHFPLVFIGKTNKKISHIYSIMVRQQAITEEAYQYWSELQQTTEGLGGLFDTMPYQVKGNIYNATNPSEPVFGYFSAGSAREKRIFINAWDLPYDLQYHPYSPCEYDSIPSGEIRSHSNETLLIAEYGALDEAGNPEGYLSSENACIDCRLQGGTTKKPLFWE